VSVLGGGSSGEPAGSSITAFATIARMAAARGTRLATLVSAFAFAFSGVSFYETVLKQPNISIFVPPVLHYARDEGGQVEVFAVPLTITNDGARTGTVLAIDLTVEAPAAGGQPGRSKTFYSAFFGEHERNTDATKRLFAPISIAGRASSSETVRFYPQGDVLPVLIEEGGSYKMRLQVHMARPANPSLIERWFAPVDPPPLAFTRVLPDFSVQLVGDRRMTVPMHAADWKPTVSPGR